MRKLIMALCLLIPLAINLMYDSRAGLDPATVRSQRVVVTGASTGIGEQLAYHYAKLGARLVITARREDLLQSVARACRDLGAQEVHHVAADMADSENQIRVIEFAKKQLDGLDQLILNHAVLKNAWWTGSAENVSTLEWVSRVNFLSYVGLASRALPMLTASRGRIGIVSSGFGEIGTVGVSVYSTSKFALNGFFSSLRQELLHKNTGVSITFVVLGPVATEEFLKVNTADLPTDSLLRPEDAAWAVLESVALRRYNVRFDWKVRSMLLLNDFFPQFSEDMLPSVMLNEDQALLSRLLWFMYST